MWHRIFFGVIYWLYIYIYIKSINCAKKWYGPPPPLACRLGFALNAYYLFCITFSNLFSSWTYNNDSQFTVYLFSYSTTKSRSRKDFWITTKYTLSISFEMRESIVELKKKKKVLVLSTLYTIIGSFSLWTFSNIPVSSIFPLSIITYNWCFGRLKQHGFKNDCIYQKNIYIYISILFGSIV